MEFVKYHSIENHYQTKFINGFLEQYPELLTAEYALTEKAHGANVSISLSPNEPWKIGKRNSFLKEGEKFYDVWSVLESYAAILRRFQWKIDKVICEPVRLYGELFGAGIQKGVNYGSKRIAFFDVVIKDRLLPPIEFLQFCHDNDLPTMPEVALVDNLQAALDYDVAFNSLLNTIEDNLCEGVVIKPRDKVYYDRKGRWFCLKKKNEKFMEKASSKKAHKPPEVVRLNLAFRTFITDNRLQSVFSKEGEIEEPSQIGTYIKWLLEDAKTDFLLEYEDEVAAMDKKNQRQVYNLGGTIAKMLKNYL